MQFGSAGVGSGSHFACAKLNAALGIDTVQCLAELGPAAQDLIGGRLDYLCALGATARQPIEVARPSIALLTADRSPLFPQLTTSRSRAWPVSTSYFWSAFLFPKNAGPIVHRLADASNQTLNRPRRCRRCARPVSGQCRGSPLGRLSAHFTVTEMKTWADQVRRAVCRTVTAGR
jgi:tripartite-type tricarboxylate transporter receptor subunit TctC